MIVKFFNFVEIKTKITSTLTFLLTMAFVVHQKYEINWDKTILFFLGMLFFDLTTTAINNYIDSKDNGQILPFERKKARNIIYVLFLVSMMLGLYLAYLTDLIILLTGVLCFIAGVLYTYGPIPISRMPLGEIASGFFYGLIIPFIILYMNAPGGTYISYSLSMQTISLSLQVIPILILFLFSVTPFAVTANIMLANNICDLEKDISVKRYTLPYYIGKMALPLFAGFYYLTYISMISMVILKILSPVALISLITLIPVQKNIATFYKKQDKATTFNLSILNFIIIMVVNSISIVLSIILNNIGN